MSDLRSRSLSSNNTNRRARVHKFLRVQNPPHSLPSPPLTRGEGGFESCAFTNFGNAVGISTCVPLSERTEGVIVNSGSAVGVIPIAEPKFTKNAVDDPLLQVPPASRGNRTPARFPSRSGGEPQGGGQLRTLAVQLVLLLCPPATPRPVPNDACNDQATQIQ